MDPGFRRGGRAEHRPDVRISVRTPWRHSRQAHQARCAVGERRQRGDARGAPRADRGDVALDVVRSFTDKVRARAVGAEVVRSVTPGQMVVKIVNDQLVEMLGSEAQSIDLNAPAPVALMMVGLQGSGKTTTSAKIARRLADRQKLKVLMASLDTRRPAAQEQLRCLACRPGSTRCRSSPASRRSRSRAGRAGRAPLAATTSSSSIPPAARTSTSR